MALKRINSSAISIHALLAESDDARAAMKRAGMISIHALLAESDIFPYKRGQGENYFYPRSPCGERLVALRYDKGIDRFLSTLSLRRATGKSDYL